MTTHLTLTGPYAGTPFCGVDKATALDKGDSFAHVPYTNAVVFLTRPGICPACLHEWELAAPEKADPDPYDTNDVPVTGSPYQAR